MKKEIYYTLICLLTSVTLAACIPSQAERDEQATEIAAGIYATLTAESYVITPTFTPEQPATPSPTQTQIEITPAALGSCRIVYTDRQDRNVFVRNCDDSSGQRVTDLVTDAYSPEHPVWSPDGQLILFVSRHEGEQLNSTNEPFGSLYVIRPDGTSLARWTRDRSDDQPAWSPDGTQIAFHRECDLAVMNLNGTGISIIAQPHEDLFCIDQSAWSPNGKQIAFTSLKWPTLGHLAEQDVFIVNADGSNPKLLAAVPAENWMEYSVVWSPDGNQIAFTVVQDGLEKYYIVQSDGSSEPTRVIEISESWYPWHWPQWDGAK